MDNLKKMLTVAAIVALTSQIYIKIFVSDFNISVAIILFPILLTFFKNLNPSQTGILSALFVYGLRIFVYGLRNGEYVPAIDSYFPELFFYMGYGVFYHILNENSSPFKIKRFFINLVLCDFFSNLMEMYVRINWEMLEPKFEIVGVLFLIALVRTFIVCVFILALKYYRMLILNQDHEERYRKLLWIISQLKTEMYWMQKNMDNIENVMSNAYSLFEKISSGKDEDRWAQISVDIAKDVHEIKKEYGLIFRGVEGIIENKLKDSGMDFKDIIKILNDSMIMEAAIKGRGISLEFKCGNSFYTEKHYQLMSIFRNLIVNAMEAIDGDSKGKIVFSHICEDSMHVFKVSDNGCGIEENEKKLIFTPGFSTKIDYNTGQINRGLGLSLVKDIVEKQFEGVIRLNPERKTGTEFIIEIEKEKLEVC